MDRSPARARTPARAAFLALAVLVHLPLLLLRPQATRSTAEPPDRRHVLYLIAHAAQPPAARPERNAARGVEPRARAPSTQAISPPPRGAPSALATRARAAPDATAGAIDNPAPLSAALAAPGAASAASAPLKLELDRVTLAALRSPVAGRAAGPAARSGEETLGRNIEQAARADCRNAYTGAALLAIPLLLVDAWSDKGCRWH